MIMRTEDTVQYSVQDEEDRGTTMLVNAKVKLAGTEVPSVQLSNSHEAEKYCYDLVGDLAAEELHIICMNSQFKVICQSCVSSGSRGSVSVDAAKIAQIALLANADSVFLTHNHPGETNWPSREDLDATRKIGDVLKLFGIQIADHIIVTKSSGCYSFAKHGDLRR